MALLRPSSVSCEVAVALDDHEAVALHAGDGLGHGRAGVTETLGDAGAKGNDVLLFEVEDGAQVHLRRIDEIGHRCLPALLLPRPSLPATAESHRVRCRSIDLWPCPRSQFLLRCCPSMDDSAAGRPRFARPSSSTWRPRARNCSEHPTARRPVKDLVGRVRSGLGSLFRMPDGYEVVVGNGGSTAFWDAASFGLIEKRAENLSFGEFGAKFAQAAGAPWLKAPKVITAEGGSRARSRSSPASTPTPGRRTRPPPASWRRSQRVDADALTVIDATSAAGGIDFELQPGRRLLLRPAEELRLGRRPVVRAALARTRSRASRPCTPTPTGTSPSS